MPNSACSSLAAFRASSSRKTKFKSAWGSCMISLQAEPPPGMALIRYPAVSRMRRISFMSSSPRKYVGERPNKLTEGLQSMVSRFKFSLTFASSAFFEFASETSAKSRLASAFFFTSAITRSSAISYPSAKSPAMPPQSAA